VCGGVVGGKVVNFGFFGELGDFFGGCGYNVSRSVFVRIFLDLNSNDC
jgi:hypothetical protein